MAILGSAIKRPFRPVPRSHTPPGARKHKVRDGDSWNSLASNHGISAWELIRLNYPDLPSNRQEAAREVNWYLQEYVGCTELTSNRRNYRFRSTDRPGEIWVPVTLTIGPVTVLTPNEVARNIVMSTLREPTIKSLNFGVGHLFIPSTNYELVAKAVEGGYIEVVQDSSLGNSAVYHWAAPHPNRISLPDYGGTPNVGNKALIIHECTHAIFDIRMISTHVEESEGMAYLAQALYSRLNGHTARHIVSQDPHDLVSQISWQLIFDESRRLAEVLTRRHRVTEAEAAALYTAIKGANFYRRRVGKHEVNDGVGDGFYLGL